MNRSIVDSSGRPVSSSPNPRRNWIKPAKISAVIGALALLLTQLKTISGFVSDLMPEKTTPQIEYVRLFGTFAVPFLVSSDNPRWGGWFYPGKNPDRSGSFVVDLSGNELRTIEEPKESFNRTGPVRHFLFEFTETLKWWNDSDFSSAGIVMTPALQQTTAQIEKFRVNPKDLENPLYKLLFSGDSKYEDYFRYLDRWVFSLDDDLISNIESNISKNGVSDDTGERYAYCKSELEKQSDKTGYLFLRISNSSEKIMTNIEVESNLFEMDELNSKAWDSIDKIRPIKEVQSKTQTVTIPTLLPGETRLLLLAVYLGDGDGYPSQFVSSTMIPKDLRWQVEGHNFDELIREPLLDKAARIKLPIGWHQQ